MQSMTIGAGLAALAFWGFVAIVSVAGIWGTIRRRESQQETLRRLIDSGQAIEPETVQKILSQGSERLDRDLMAGGLIMVCIAPGLAAMGWFLKSLAPESLMPLLGAAVLTFSVGIGLLAGSWVIGRSYRHDESQ